MNDLSFDVLVVGSGAAGLSAALRAADLGARVGVLTAGPLLAGSSPRAQGGVAAAIGADDTPALHARDTLQVGAGLNDASAVDVLTRFGTRSVLRLREAGVPFAEDLGLEAGHARRRILHAGGGATGQVLTSALLARAQAHPRIALLDHSPVAALILECGRVVGVEVSAHLRARAFAVAPPQVNSSRAQGGRAPSKPPLEFAPDRADPTAGQPDDTPAPPTGEFDRQAGDSHAYRSGEFGRAAGDGPASSSGEFLPPAGDSHAYPSGEFGRTAGDGAAYSSGEFLRPAGDTRASSSREFHRPADDATASPSGEFHREAGDSRAYPSGEFGRAAGDGLAGLSGDFQGAQPLGPSERNGHAPSEAMARITAPAVILATGGYAALWSRTTNAPETRGSGLALAYNAGATLADLEFVQFHPTALDLDGAPALLLSEALRGEGARLIDDDGHDVINPLLPRDVLARALHRELTRGRRVYLSLRHLDPDHVYAHFSSLAAKLTQTSGLDLARDRLPVAPAAHYCMGGIRTDTWGRTDVAGLYAAGETACSGAQGANRLASNSLLECLVFGARTAEAALQHAGGPGATWATTPLPPHFESSARPIAGAALGATLDRQAGVERNGDDLLRLVASLPDPDLANSPPADLQVASLIARAALLRRESRGAHFRTDYPESDPSWRGRIHSRRGQAPVFEEVFA